MRDTIELLETLGSDATLRYTTPEDRAHMLEAANASVGLREFAATRNDVTLIAELGMEDGKGWRGEHSSQTGAHEDVDDLRIH